MISEQDIRAVAQHGKEREGTFKLPCGHSVGYKEPIYPFDWVCCECGNRSTFVLQKVKE